MKKLMGIAAAAGFALAGPAAVAQDKDDSFTVQGTVPQVCNMSIPVSTYDLAVGNNNGNGEEGGLYVTFDCNVPFGVTVEAATGTLSDDDGTACDANDNGDFPYEAALTFEGFVSDINVGAIPGPLTDSTDSDPTFTTTDGQARFEVTVDGDGNGCAGDYSDDITVTLSPGGLGS